MKINFPTLGLKRTPTLVFIFLFSLILPNFSFAQESQIYIDVGQAQVKKSLMALTPLLYAGSQPTNPVHIQTGQNIYQVLFNNLSVANYFSFISPDAYLEDPAKIGLRPAPGLTNGFNFKNWSTIGTEFLVRASYQIVGSDLTLETYFYHVPTTKLVLAKTYKGSVSAYRRLAHTVANDMIKALTGKPGMFLTKLVASRQDKRTGTDPEKAFKEIYIMDWDGTGAQKISNHNSIALSPTWSTNGEKIAYTAFAYHKAHKVRNADLFIYELATGKRYLVSYRKGMNSGAAFFPGDQSLALTLSQDGSPDIYRMSSDGNNLRALTNGPNKSMNVEPAISPDGKSIAFSSDRAGRPMVFVMNADGTEAKRITFVGKYNASPAWSPDGKTLAFAGYDKDHFDIFTIGVDGSNLKRLTDARKTNGKASNNESPSWSPDGRHIVFTSDRTGHYQLHIVNPDGTNERRITNDNFDWDRPKWSPFLN